MKTTKLIYSLALTVTFALNFTIHAAGAAESLPAIFNGKDFTGWKVPEPNPFWKVANDVIVGENDEAKKGSMLWTEKSYGDFVIECEARWSGEIDSGIMLRKPELQLQMGVSRSLKRDLTGSFYIGGTEKYPEVVRRKTWRNISSRATGTTTGSKPRATRSRSGSTECKWSNTPTQITPAPGRSACKFIRVSP